MAKQTKQNKKRGSAITNRRRGRLDGLPSAREGRLRGAGGMRRRCRRLLHVAVLMRGGERGQIEFLQRELDEGTDLRAAGRIHHEALDMDEEDVRTARYARLQQRPLQRVTMRAEVVDLLRLREFPATIRTKQTYMRYTKP